MRYRFAEFLLDTEQARLSGPEGDIALRRQTLRALGLLLERAPALVSREELLDAVWGRQAISANTVSQTILELRKALGDSATEARLIETRHRVGYRIVPVVERELTLATDPTDTAAVPAADGNARRDSRTRIAGVALILLALVGAGLWWVRGQNDSSRLALAELRERGSVPMAISDDYWSGLLALQDGRLAEALLRLQRANMESPDNLSVRAAYARALVTAGRFREAQAIVEQAGDAVAALPRGDHLRWEALAADAIHDRRTAMNRYQAVFGYQPADVESGFRLFALQQELADANAAAATLSVLQNSAAAPSRLLLARAQLAALQGDPDARRSLAEQAQAAAEPGTARALQATLAICEARFASAELAQADACASGLEKQSSTQAHTRIALRAAALSGAVSREEGRYPEAAKKLQAVADEAKQQGDGIVWRDVELGLAMNERMAGDLSAALARLDRVEAALSFADDQPGHAALLGVRGITLAQSGDVDGGRDALVAAIRESVALDQRQLEAGARNNMALLDARNDRGAESIDGFEKALQLFRALGDRRGEATALSNLAIHAMLAGQAAKARDYNLEALAAFRAINAHSEIARLQFNLGVAERRSGDLQAAIPRIEEALDVFVDRGVPSYAAQAAATLSLIHLDRADAAAAAVALARVKVDDVQDPLRRAALLAAAGRLAFYRGELEAARSQMDEARLLREQAGARSWVIESELDLAQLDLAEGRLDRASSSATRLATAALAEDELADAARGHLLLATSWLLRREPANALPVLSRAAELLEKADDPALRLEQEWLGLVARQAGVEVQRELAARAQGQGYGLLALRMEYAAAANAVERARVAERIEAAGFAPAMFAVGWREG